MNVPLGDVAVRPGAIVAPDDSAPHALRVLLAACSPEACVLDEQGRFLGILTDSELLKAALNGSLAELSVSQLMHRNPQTLTISQTLADAAPLFRNGNLSRVPVLRGECLAGIIRRSDVLRWYANQSLGDCAEQVAVPAPQFLTSIGRCAAPV